MKIKKLLIEYLSLLLKHDWERSKNEIFGNIKIYAFDVVFWIGFIVLLFYCLHIHGFITVN